MVWFSWNFLFIEGVLGNWISWDSSAWSSLLRFCSARQSVEGVFPALFMVKNCLLYMFNESSKFEDKKDTLLLHIER